ncbi:hypothetical protein KUCAC02_021124, partial [Chaenocephalus aceratus]
AVSFIFTYDCGATFTCSFSIEARVLPAGLNGARDLIQMKSLLASPSLHLFKRSLSIPESKQARDRPVTYRERHWRGQALSQAEQNTTNNDRVKETEKERESVQCHMERKNTGDCLSVSLCCERGAVSQACGNKPSFSPLSPTLSHSSSHPVYLYFTPGNGEVQQQESGEGGCEGQNQAAGPDPGQGALKPLTLTHRQGSGPTSQSQREKGLYQQGR